VAAWRPESAPVPQQQCAPTWAQGLQGMQDLVNGRRQQAAERQQGELTWQLVQAVHWVPHCAERIVRGLQVRSQHAGTCRHASRHTPTCKQAHASIQQAHFGMQAGTCQCRRPSFTPSCKQAHPPAALHQQSRGPPEQPPAARGKEPAVSLLLHAAACYKLLPGPAPR
jgi:hypothetical protein